MASIGQMRPPDHFQPLNELSPEIDIFICNIVFGLDVKILIGAIARIVHSPAYERYNRGSLLNFRVFLHPRKKQHAPRRGSGGTGLLTFPSRVISQKFLEDCGGDNPMIPIIMGGRRISFSVSRKTPRQDVLEHVKRLPFVDPRAIEEIEHLQRELTEVIHVKAIQFGWECRDDAFSVEWERRCQEPCYLQFNGDRREMRLKLEGPEQTQVVAISFSQISYTAVSDVSGASIIYLSLLWRPAFELESSPKVQEQLMLLHTLSRPNATIYDLIPRQKLSSWEDPDLQEITSHVSLAIRLVCHSPGDLKLFRSLSRLVHLQQPWSDDYPVVRRALFSRSARDELESWLTKLPWLVAFHVTVLYQNDRLDTKELLGLKPHINELCHRKGRTFTADFLQRFYSDLDKLWAEDDSDQSTDSVVVCFQRTLKTFSPDRWAAIKKADEDQFDCFHVYVTPTCVRPVGQYRERSNRVIRSYPDHHDSFLRVTFLEENDMPYRFDREVAGPDFVKRRVGGFLKHGIQIGGRRFKFLSYSQSALKDHSVWFVKPFVDRTTRRTVNAQTIISSLGTFDNIPSDPRLMYCPARYGARLSQAFTATDTSVSVEAEEIIIINDIKRNGSCFTDGVGTVSGELAEAIQTKMLENKKRKPRKGRPIPRAFQVRFQGSKGMLSVDHKLSGRAICLRPSMIKFESPNDLHIEIARAFDKPSKMFLNRPLIMLLDGLGVPAEVFLELQAKAVQDVQMATTSLERTANLLDTHGLSTSFRLSSVLLSLKRLNLTINDPFYDKLLEIAVNHILRELKHRARIPVPGWTLVGVADEHDYLDEDEIFACVHEPDSSRYYLAGLVLITRSPVIHPGDVRVVRAIGRPPKGSPFASERLENTVVFSTKGQRSLPSCLGGGDLDGDVYNITAFDKLFPKHTHEAAAYTAAPRKELDRLSTIADVADFVVDYIISDILGIIATTWLVIADQSTASILDPDCLTLSQLHSDAVDYPKSGQPVPIIAVPKYKFRAKPDWNAPETVQPGANYYQSTRAIGQLFRAIELPHIDIPHLPSRGDRRHRDDGGEADLTAAFQGLTTQTAQANQKDPIYTAVRGEVDQFIYTESISADDRLMLNGLFERYAGDLDYICRNHTLSRSRSARLTEEEAVIGTIVAKCAHHRRRNDIISKLREGTRELVGYVRDELKGDDDFLPRDSLRRAWAGWQLAIEIFKKDVFGARSFWWICLGAVFEAIKSIEEEEHRL